MIEIGNLAPLRALEASLEEWESRVRTRPLPDTDPVAHALATVRHSLKTAMLEAAHVELELSIEQYAALSGVSRNALYKRYQRGKLPEARMRGGKLVVPLVDAMEHAA